LERNRRNQDKFKRTRQQALGERYRKIERRSKKAQKGSGPPVRPKGGWAVKPGGRAGGQKGTRGKKNRKRQIENNSRCEVRCADKEKGSKKKREKGAAIPPRCVRGTMDAQQPSNTGDRPPAWKETLHRSSKGRRLGKLGNPTRHKRPYTAPQFKKTRDHGSGDQRTILAKQIRCLVRLLSE